MTTISKETILTKLETIYQAAVRTNKWPTALRVTQLQGAYIGLFEKRQFSDDEETRPQATEFQNGLSCS
ncbi:MAG: hypothetical protein ACOH2E_07685, partial [Candidatus Paracaedibacter sp.]